MKQIFLIFVLCLFAGISNGQVCFGGRSDVHVPRFIQSPYSASDFWTNWNSVNPRQALFMKITSKADFGSVVYGFTSNTRDMTLPGHPGVTFRSAPAITPSVIEQGLDEAPTLEMTGVYTSDSFTQFQVLAGMWNFAAIEIFSACWDDQSATGGIDKRKYGELLHFNGHLGEFKDYQTYFKCEGRGKISRLSQDVDFVTQRLCRAPEFRDPVFCKHTASTVVINSVTYNIVETVMPDGSFAPEDTFLVIVTSGFAGNVPPENFYRNGKVTPADGLNAGVSREIAFNSAASGGFMNIQLKRSFPFGLSGSETLTLTAGCDKTPEMCMLYDNIVNRRAEDFIPGVESVSRLPQ